jgi:proteic killer suppression protein
LNCAAYRYALHADHDHRLSPQGTESVYRTGSTRGVRVAHESKLGRTLAALDAAATAVEQHQPGCKLDPRKGTLKGPWSVWANGSWRVMFRFVGPDVELVDYQGCD